MKYFWRRLTGRCTCCGQKLDSEQTIQKRLSEINKRAVKLAKTLGRWPEIQTCPKCDKMILEGQAGFGESLLLIHMQ